MSFLKKKAANAQPEGAVETAQAAIPGVKIPTGRKKRKTVRIVVIVAVVAVAAVAIIPRVMQKKGGAVDSGYLVEKAVRMDLTETVTGTATLEPADSYNVTTLISGEVLSAPVEEGDQINKDDLLFSIDASDAQNSAESAAIAVEQARNSYAQAQQAMYPTAALSGTVAETYVKNGDSVTAGTALCRIVSGTDMNIDFSFTYDSADGIYAGQSAQIYITGYAGSVAGTVVSVSDSYTVGATGMKLKTVRVKLSNPGALAAGSTAQASIGGNYSYGSAPVAQASAGTVYASGSGTVKSFSKTAGSTVTAGEVLCTVDSESNRTQLANAKLAISSSALSQNSAQDNMKNYQITSPISGQVIERNYKVGDTVKGMDSGTLAVIYDLSYLKLKMDVDELYIRRVKTGQKVTITADAVEGQSFEGTVDKVSINGTTTGGVTTYPVTIIIENYGELMPGMNVSVTILGETAKDAVCIPVDAVSRGNVVLVAGEGAMNADGTGVVDKSKIEERQVSLGRNDETYIEVTDGLKEGDTVLIENQSSNMMSMMGR